MASTSGGSPASSTSLFGPDRDWQHNACLNYGLDNWYLYAEGYKQAADYLVDRVIETDEDQDTLVYPIVFLYRQYAELRLKQVARDASYLLGEPFTLKTTHRLDVLWRDAFSLLERVERGPLATEVLAAEAVIKEFSQVDPTSMEFRYPEDTSGGPSLPAIRYINLRQLRDVFAKAAVILDGAVEALAYYRDMANEARGYY